MIHSNQEELSSLGCTTALVSCRQTTNDQKIKIWVKSWTFGNVATGFSVGRISCEVHMVFSGEKP